MRSINIVAKPLPKPPTYGTYPATKPPGDGVYLVTNATGALGYALWTNSSWYSMRKTIQGAYAVTVQSSKLNKGPTYWNKI